MQVHINQISSNNHAVPSRATDTKADAAQLVLTLAEGFGAVHWRLIKLMDLQCESPIHPANHSILRKIWYQFTINSFFHNFFYHIKGCLVQDGNGIELDTVGRQFKPYQWRPCHWCDLRLWSRTVVVIKLRRTSAYKQIKQLNLYSLNFILTVKLELVNVDCHGRAALVARREYTSLSRRPHCRHSLRNTFAALHTSASSSSLVCSISWSMTSCHWIHDYEIKNEFMIMKSKMNSCCEFMCESSAVKNIVKSWLFLWMS